MSSYDQFDSEVASSSDAATSSSSTTSNIPSLFLISGDIINPMRVLGTKIKLRLASWKCHFWTKKNLLIVFDRMCIGNYKSFCPFYRILWFTIENLIVYKAGKYWSQTFDPSMLVDTTGQIARKSPDIKSPDEKVPSNSAKCDKRKSDLSPEPRPRAR